MEWLNIHSGTLDSEAFLDASPGQQATWLKVFRYCAGQENGGRICTCKNWSDRKWQQVVRVTLKEIKSVCKLWEFEDDDLHLEFYPIDREKEVRAKRLAGYSTQNKLSAKRGAEQERKGREGKGREGDSPTNRVSLVEAIAYFKQIGSDYTDAEVRTAWTTFEATAEEGFWLFGKRRVGDWRAALEARMATGRDFQKKNGAAAANGELKRERGEILQEMSAARLNGDKARVLELEKELERL